MTTIPKVENENEPKILGSDEFIGFIENKENNIKNVLIGNGFGLSHPDLKKCFKWNMDSALRSDEINLIPPESRGCPEKDLRNIRLIACKAILKYYLDQLKKGLSVQSDRIPKYIEYINNRTYDSTDFLKILCSEKINIFTLNYDPVMYFEFLTLANKDKDKDKDKDEDEKKFCDGFRGERFLEQRDIASYLKNETIKSKIYYLHGSWFIQLNERENTIRKLSFRKDSPDLDLEELFKLNKHPHLILEDRWQVKKSLLNSSLNTYLNHCYKSLEKISGNLLVFGVSFSNDQHILEAIIKSDVGRVFITYHKNKEDLENTIKENIKELKKELEREQKDQTDKEDKVKREKAEEKLEKLEKFESKIKWRPVEEDVLWTKKTIAGEKNIRGVV